MTRNSRWMWTTCLMFVWSNVQMYVYSACDFYPDWANSNHFDDSQTSQYTTLIMGYMINLFQSLPHIFFFSSNCMTRGCFTHGLMLTMDQKQTE